MPFLVIAALILAIGASAGPVGQAAGFEDDDGNLAPGDVIQPNQPSPNFDWNSFAPTTWTGTTPFRQSDKVVSGWTFKGLEDAQATTSDSAFDGGVKQDKNCPGVGTGKAPNKDDLKRAYLATKIVNANVYLMLAWVRIPQKTTSPSAHIGFEFNQGEDPANPCATGGLVNRVAGDLLIVYDFEGGATDTPVITLREWVDSGACEVGNSSPPCWGTATNLTALGFAEARVNTFGSVSDAIAPSPTESLGTNEFGEAGINLTAAGVFSPGTCESFGSAYAVSRSSGNSGTAQMKDIAGPGDFALTNCGTVTIIKQTVPAGVNQNFEFTSTLAGSEISCSPDTSPASFTLNDSSSDTETCTNVPAGSYTVTEGANPPGFVFTDLTCSASGAGTSVTPDGSGGDASKTASITMAGGGSVTCTYTNTQQLGAIKITKTSSKTSNALPGAMFSITLGGNAISGSPFTTDSNGEICVDGLAFGTYVVTETAAPTGFKIDSPTGRNVAVNNNADCDDDPYVGASESFTNTPLAEIQIRFRDLGSGETQLGTALSCTNTTGTDDTSDTTGWDDTLTVTDIEAPEQFTCTFDIDP